MEWMLQVVDELDDAVGVLRHYAAGMRTELGLLTAEYNASNVFRVWNRCLAGAQESIIKGDIQPAQISSAEFKACDPKPADPNSKTTTLATIP